MIQIDTHETRSKLPGILKKIGVPTTFVPLEIGDYIISGTISACGSIFYDENVCNELKTVEDYLGSIRSGRLNNELFQMSSAYDRSFLIVHGSLDQALAHRKIKRSTYFHYLAGCVVHESGEGKRGSISVFNFETVYDTALFLKTIHDLITQDKIIREPTTKKPIKKLKIPLDKQRLFTIQSLPDIAGIRALRLKTAFPTLKSLINAEKEDLMKIEGIGEGIAESLYNFFNEE